MSGLNFSRSWLDRWARGRLLSRRFGPITGAMSSLGGIALSTGSKSVEPIRLPLMTFRLFLRDTYLGRVLTSQLQP